jgi:NADPH-dependent 2,4-dienoyl-CoA reductase/sulfur reductase-like enzyme
VDETSPKKAVIIGGGYIGLEMAEALILRGWKYPWWKGHLR